MNSSNEPSEVPSLSGALIKGTAWTIAMRWVSRFLGIISLAICARILSPSDYGLVNMAMVAIGFSNVLVEFGIDAALIRNQKATAEHYNTAWSLRIMQSALLALLILASAPIAAYFFKDERVIPIMVAVSITGFIGGFKNIYIVDLRKHLDFGRDFLFLFIPRLASFILGVTCVIWLESYWGLVVGICITEPVRMITSYIIIKQRAHWRLTEWRELTSFSAWYFFRGFAEFITFEFDRFFIGVLGGSREVGIYGTSREVASLPETELVDPISRALMPTLSKLNDLPERQAAAISKALSGTMLVSVPASVGFAAIAYEFILLMFGDKWIEVATIVPIVCLSAMTGGFRTTATNVLVTIGKVRSSAILCWGQTVLSVALLFPSYHYAGLVGVTSCYAAINLLMMITQGVYFHKLGLLKGRSLWIDLSRPIIASVLMYVGIQLFATYLPESLILSMLIKIALGALIYISILSGLWFLMGKSDSSELILFGKVESILKRYGLRT